MEQDLAIERYSRSREGARIEINYKLVRRGKCHGRSREGARIEMPQANLSAFAVGVAPARERGLKSHGSWWLS